MKSFYREFGINSLLSGDYRGSLIAESALWYATIAGESMKSFTEVKSFYMELGINSLFSGDYRGSLICRISTVICHDSRRINAIIYRQNRRSSEIILQGVWD